ncbi:hypothetical protein D3C72_1344060 [compost metagenome]
MQAWQQGRDLFRWCNAEGQSTALAAVPGLPQVGTLAAFQAEVVQRHHGLFTQLDQAQPEIEIGLPIRFTHLVEHRAQAEPVGFLAEAPDQCTRHLGWPDRVTHRDQRAAVALHHHKALVFRIAQHRLVGGQHQAGLGIGSTCQHRCQRLQGCVVGRRQRAARAVQQPRQPEHHQCHRHQQQRTQRARCIAGHRELPPQLVLVFDMAVSEEQQPGHRHQHQAEVAQPWPRPGFVQQRALAIELAPRRPQRHRHQQRRQGDQRLATAQPDRQRRDHADRHRQHPGRVAAAGQALADQQQGDAAQAADQVRGFQDRQ